MWRLLEVAEQTKTAKARGANRDFSRFAPMCKTAKGLRSKVRLLRAKRYRKTFEALGQLMD